MSWALFSLGALVLAAMIALLRLSVVTDYMYSALVKDPERSAPDGPVIVAPADGVVLYVRKITDGIIPYVVKRGVEVPLVEHLKAEPSRPFQDGYLIGIYMNTHGVHINRMPNTGPVAAGRSAGGDPVAGGAERSCGAGSAGVGPTGPRDSPAQQRTTQVPAA